MNIKDKIREALKGQTTGLLSAEIRVRGKIDSAKACNLALTHMKASGEVLKHAGDSPKKSRYTLNPEYLEGPDSAGGGAHAEEEGEEGRPRKGQAALRWPRGACRAGRSRAAVHRRAASRPLPGHAARWRAGAVLGRGDRGDRQPVRPALWVR